MLALADEPPTTVHRVERPVVGREEGRVTVYVTESTGDRQGRRRRQQRGVPPVEAGGEDDVGSSILRSSAGSPPAW